MSTGTPLDPRAALETISEQQAASTQEITANLSRVTHAAEELKDYIKKLA